MHDYIVRRREFKCDTSASASGSMTLSGIRSPCKQEVAVSRMAGEPDDTGHDNTRSSLSGSAGDVVQARDVRGGIHFHYGRGSRAAMPQQLPRGVRVFINRASDIARLNELLADPRFEDGAGVVYLINGAAGVGKTSLALHWAHQVRDRFPDGQLYIDLRGHDPDASVTPDQSLERFLLALGVPAAAIPRDPDAKSDLYRTVLADRRTLIILDNAATVGQVRPLIPGTGNNLTLVTSRSRMPGLAIRDGAQWATLGTLSTDEAVELLTATMTGYRQGDQVEDLAELASLCARLPLALRIAAERAVSRPGMPLTDLISELRDESGLWTALATDDEDEANAVRTVFAWSYRALSTEAARLFCLLGLHPGAEFSEPAAVALAGDEVAGVRHSLDVLTGVCLLDSQTYGRYRFHDLLRAYAVDRARFEVAQEAQLAAVRRICDWYLMSAYNCAVLSAHDAKLPFSLDTSAGATFPDRDQAAAWYLTERANLAGAVGAAADTGQLGLALRLASILERIYSSYNHFHDWRSTSLIGLRAARELGATADEALMSESLGRLSRLTMQLDEAAEYYDTAITIHAELGDTLNLVKDLNGLAWVHLFGHRLDDAYSSLRDALARAEGLGDDYWIATIRGNLGYACLQLLDPEQAEPNLVEALAKFRDLGDRLYESMVLTFMSLLERSRGGADMALETARRAAEISTELSNQLWEATALLFLGKAQLAADDAEAALASFHHAALICRQEGDLGRESRAIDGAGRAYRDLGRSEEAAAFFRRAVAVHRQLGDNWKLAMSLGRLADVDRDLHSSEQYRREAISILTEFTDPRSLEARERIETALRDQGLAL